MKSLEVVVCKNLGMDTQLVTDIIEGANKYESAIWVRKDEKEANAKSLLGVLSLGIVEGCKVTIVAEGNDEGDAINYLKKMVTAY